MKFRQGRGTKEHALVVEGIFSNRGTSQHLKKTSQRGETRQKLAAGVRERLHDLEKKPGAGVDILEDSDQIPKNTQEW